MARNAPLSADDRPDVLRPLKTGRLNDPANGVVADLDHMLDHAVQLERLVRVVETLAIRASHAKTLQRPRPIRYDRLTGHGGEQHAVAEWTARATHPDTCELI